MSKPTSSCNRPLGKIVDSTWMKEMSACFDPQINLHHLPDHLCVRDSKEIVSCKINCANLALSQVKNEISQSSNDVRKSRNSRYIESSDEEDDYYTLPTFNLVSVSSKAVDTNSISTTLLESFAKALPLCYPFTFHLMCREWSCAFKTKPISYCPLCPTMNGWQTKHKLAIDEQYLCYRHDDRRYVKNQKNVLKL